MRRAAVRAMAVLAAVWCLAGYASTETRTRQVLDWPFTIAPLPSPATLGSAQPQMTVSSRGVLLSWIERAGPRASLVFAERTTSGWSAPRTVASGDDWFVNWADVPSVQRLDDGSLVAHWLQKNGPDPYAYDVRLAYSTDDGRTWSRSFTPHHDGTRTEHGFASLFQMPAGGLGLVWLDGRAMAGAAGHAGHGASAGAMSLRAATFDRRWQQTSELVVAPRVCECCPTAAALTGEGPIVAFRNRTRDEVRDIFVARVEHGRWTEPVTVHHDGWTVGACPVNGPALSALERDVAVAWFTVRDDTGQVYVGFSRDGGRTFGRPVRVDSAAALGRADVEMLPDGSAVVSWLEVTDKGAAFSARRVDASGRTSPVVTLSEVGGSRASGYPRLARSGDELIFAWIDTSGGTSMVQTAIATRHSSR